MSVYTIDAASGALTPLTGSPLPLGTLGVAISLNPVQPFAYSTYNSAGRVGLASYSVDTITGALSNIANLTYPAAVEIGAIAVDPTGRFVYVLTDPLRTFVTGSCRATKSRNFAIIFS